MPWKPAALLLAALLGTTAAMAQQPEPSQPTPSSALPPVAPAGRPSVGLALEGGGALGLAHVGVLQWLEEHHIPVDRVAGTSMGALVGALYASGRSPEQMRAIAISPSISSVFTVQTPYADASFRRRQDRREVPQFLTLGLRNRYALRNALLTDRGVNEFLSRELFEDNSEQLDYNRLPIPFRCVATDLATLHAITFSHGPLPAAVRASISIPGVFSPVQGPDGHMLVDGGIVDNLPTGVLRRDLHADVVIAIHLEDSLLSPSDTVSIVGVLNRAFAAGIVHNVEESEKLANVVVNVPVSGFSGSDYSKAAELIAVGYKAAEQSRAALLPYALSDSGWQAYLAARNSRRVPPPGSLRQVRVQGGEPGAVQQVERDLKSAEGKPLSQQSVLAGLKGVQADGEYEATYETYAVTGNAAGGGDGGILVHLRRDPNGPPFLLVAPQFAAATSNVSRGNLVLRLVHQNLGGFGSELRAGAVVGYNTDLSAEYYRLLTPAGYFVEPQARVLREPVYMWANQKRIAERFQQNLEAGLVAGRTFSNRFQVAAQWRAIDTRWSLRTGTDGGPYLTGTAQTGELRFALDNASSATVFTRGFRLAASAGALYHAVGSDNAPLVRLAFTGMRPWKGENILGVSGEVQSYLRARVAQPYRFTLGGPLRLSASSFDEYRGTDTMLAHTGYMHRIAPMPTGMGQSLYAVLGYEAGEIWSPESRATLRQDGVTGLVANTPIGVITFGVSVGDAGRRKVFFTIGRWF